MEALEFNIKPIAFDKTQKQFTPRAIPKNSQDPLVVVRQFAIGRVTVKYPHYRLLTDEELLSKPIQEQLLSCYKKNQGFSILESFKAGNAIHTGNGFVKLRSTYLVDVTFGVGTMTNPCKLKDHGTNNNIVNFDITNVDPATPDSLYPALFIHENN